MQSLDLLTSFGTTLQGHSSPRAPNCLRSLLKLCHNPTSPSVQSCFLHCSQALFQRMILNKPAWKYQGLTVPLLGKATCRSRSVSRKEALKWGCGSWTAHCPAGDELLECCNSVIVKTITWGELGWDTGGMEQFGSGNILDAWRIGGNNYYKDDGICLGIARNH